jgi:hypothetical protein
MKQRKNDPVELQAGSRLWLDLNSGRGRSRRRRRAFPRRLHGHRPQMSRRGGERALGGEPDLRRWPK